MIKYNIILSIIKSILLYYIILLFYKIEDKIKYFTFNINNFNIQNKT